MSDLENALAMQIKWAKLPEPEREFCRAIPGRKFRFDFAWPEFRLLVEVQGGTWINGGHSSGSGIARDCEKGNLATLAGWKVLHVTGDQIRSGIAIQFLQTFFEEAS